jgi:hypothetical protein
VPNSVEESAIIRFALGFEKPIDQSNGLMF